MHDGIAEELPNLDDNPNTVTFNTGKFSLYALVYEDVNGDELVVEPPKSDASDAVVAPAQKDNNMKQQTGEPDTGDMSPIVLVFLMMLVAAALNVILTRKIKNK